MSELNIPQTHQNKETICISNIEIPIIEYKGERVITFKIIDKLHQRPQGTAGRNFRQNRDRFKACKHYFEAGRDEFRRDLWEACGFNKFAAKGIFITKRGYTMLMKSFNDDLAWKIQEELTDYYFQDNDRLSSRSPMILEKMVQIENLLSDVKQQIAKHDDDICYLKKWLLSLDPKQVYML